MAEVLNHQEMDDFVAHLPEVAAAVDQLAARVAAKAKAKLQEHRRTGRMSIETERRNPDRIVWLVDPDGGAVAAEFGHIADNGTVVQPLNIMAQAAEP
jgi:hypothetical protein